MNEKNSKHTMDRRGFLQSAALVAAAGGLPGLAPKAAKAIEPITRDGKPKFKFSLAAYSYRDLLTKKAGQPAQLTIEDFIADCAKMGLEGTELTSYYFPADTTSAYLRQVKSLCFRLGLDVSGTAVGNDFCHPPGEKRNEQIALVKRWSDNAAILSAPVIRIFAGKVQKGQDEAAAHRLIVEGIAECCQYAGERGVFLALENHGGPTATPEGLLAIVKDVQSPWFGVNLDSGNFATADPYGDLAKIAPYALNAQVKVVVKPSGGSKEPTDMRRLARIMRDSGYRGYIVLEFEEPEDPRIACPRYVDEMRQAFS
jgi:sugar phosphate isomerase/epimerase